MISGNKKSYMLFGSRLYSEVQAMKVNNSKVYMLDKVKVVMGIDTKIGVSKETRKRLHEARNAGKFISYDEMFQYWLKKCPITAPVSGGEVD